MDMNGEYRIPASRTAVWEALNDPEILRQSISGCESLERVGDHQFTAAVVAKVGPVKAKFNGKVTLSDLDPPNGYTISGEGTGGAAGFAKGGAKVNLYDVDGGDTLLRYEAKADVGGKLAQIGSRLIQGTAKKMADDFFAKFGSIVAARSGRVPTPAPPVEHVAAAPPPPAPPPPPGEPAPTPSIASVEASAGIPPAPTPAVEPVPPGPEPLAPPQAVPVPPAQPAKPVTPVTAATSETPAYRPPPPAPPPTPTRAGANRTTWIVVAIIVLLLLIWIIS